MNSFKDFNIKPVMTCFNGKKIEIEDILNREIVVCAFKIEPSKYQKKPGDKCLHLQIKVDDIERVVFTSGTMLMTMLGMVDEKRFPFKTTIIKQNKQLQFS